MEMYEIGSVTYCTNVPKGYFPSDEDADYVASQVENLFRAKLSTSAFADEVDILQVTYCTGCIITTITLGVSVGAIYRFVRDYPKFRPGLMLLLKDINGFLASLRDSEKRGSTYVMREDLLDADVLSKLAREAETGKAKARKSSKGRTRAKARSDAH